jgi:hypothetical protein
VALAPPLAADIQQTNDSPKYQLNAKKAQVLAHYSLELIVDQSLSMHTKDCPNGLSRWDWCGVQAADIATALAPYVPGGITITPFNGSYYIYEHLTTPQIIDLFRNPRFAWGTRLAEPLQARLDTYLSNYKPGTKPLLITVITDGCPVPEPEPEQTKQVLVDVTKRMVDPHQITVVFLQIGGHDSFGTHYLEDLDANLVNYGARYGIVQTKTFDQLQVIGLGEALVDTIQDFNIKTGQTPPDAGVNKSKTKKKTPASKAKLPANSKNSGQDTTSKPINQ